MTLITGNKGKVNFKFPFDKYNSDAEWTIGAIDLIPHIQMFGVKVLELVYTENELPESDYIRDTNNGVKIIAFINDAQQILYIPDYLVELTDEEHGYEYVEKVLAVPLPALPVDYSLDNLKDDIKSVVKDKIGYDVNVEEVELSGITLQNATNHKAMIDKLNNNALKKRSYKTRYLEVVEQNTNLIEIKTQLEKELMKYMNT